MFLERLDNYRVWLLTERQSRVVEALLEVSRAEQEEAAANIKNYEETPELSLAKARIELARIEALKSDPPGSVAQPDQGSGSATHARGFWQWAIAAP